MADSCIQSDEEASSSGELTRHQRSQEEELFIESGKLTTGNLSDSGEKLFVCTHCDQAFNRSALKRHKILLAEETLL